MSRRKRVIFMAAGLLAASAPAWAQSGLDAETLKLYGGTYSADCSSAAAPRLRVASDTLAVERGNKRLTGRNVQASYSFFGQSPPPDYQVALMSDVRPGVQMLFIVYRDKRGQYITLDGDAKVQAALGRDLLARKYRSCNPAANEAPRPPASAAAKAPADAIIGPPELLQDAKFKSIYYKALGPKVKESWLAELDGPAPPVKKITVGGTEYLFASACKNHDCGDNNTVLLYSAVQGVVYGKNFAAAPRVVDRRAAAADRGGAGSPLGGGGVAPEAITQSAAGGPQYRNQSADRKTPMRCAPRWRGSPTAVRSNSFRTTGFSAALRDV